AAAHARRSDRRLAARARARRRRAHCRGAVALRARCPREAPPCTSSRRDVRLAAYRVVLLRRPRAADRVAAIAHPEPAARDAGGLGGSLRAPALGQLPDETRCQAGDRVPPGSPAGGYARAARAVTEGGA